MVFAHLLAPTMTSVAGVSFYRFPKAFLSWDEIESFIRHNVAPRIFRSFDTVAAPSRSARINVSHQRSGVHVHADTDVRVDDATVTASDSVVSLDSFPRLTKGNFPLERISYYFSRGPVRFTTSFAHGMRCRRARCCLRSLRAMEDGRVIDQH